MAVTKHKQVTGIKYELNKRDILLHTGITEDEYCNIQFDRAIEWIKQKVWNDEEFVNVILSQPEFREWWINQWNLREAEFIWSYIGYFITNQDFTVFLRERWFVIHEIANINSMPTDGILSDSIKQLLKKKEVRND